MKSTTMNNVPTNWKSRVTQNGLFHTFPKNWLPDDYLHTKTTFTLLTRNGPFHTFPRVGSVTTLFTHALLLSRSLSLSLPLAVDRFPDPHADAHTRSEIEILLISFQWFDAVPWSFGLVFWWVVQNELLLLLLLHFLSGDFCSRCGVFLGLLLASLLPWFWKLDRSLTRSRSGVLFWLWI